MQARRITPDSFDWACTFSRMDPAKLSAWVDREVSIQNARRASRLSAFDGDEMTDKNKWRFERYFSSPDFEPQKSTSRAARFSDASLQWEIP